jgi:hypothetical protein
VTGTFARVGAPMSETPPRMSGSVVRPRRKPRRSRTSDIGAPALELRKDLPEFRLGEQGCRRTSPICPWLHSSSMQPSPSSIVEMRVRISLSRSWKSGGSRRATAGANFASAEPLHDGASLTRSTSSIAAFQFFVSRLACGGDRILVRSFDAIRRRLGICIQSDCDRH